MCVINIKINNLDWSINFVESSTTINKLDIKDTDEYGLGITRRSCDMIIINKDLPDDLIKRIIDHEIVHAYFWSYGLSQYQNFTEENIADFIETHGRSIIDDSDYVYKKYKEEISGTE